MVFECEAKDANQIAVRGSANAQCLHGPGKAIDQAPLNELQCFRLLTYRNAGKRLAEEPGAQNITPVRRPGIRGEGIKFEDTLGQTRDRRNCRVGIAVQYPGVGLDEEEVCIFRYGVQRMPSRQSHPRKEVVSTTRCCRLTPDKAAAGHEAGLQNLLHLLVLTQQATVPKG